MDLPHMIQVNDIRFVDTQKIRRKPLVHDLGQFSKIFIDPIICMHQYLPATALIIQDLPIWNLPGDPSAPVTEAVFLHLSDG